MFAKERQEQICAMLRRDGAVTTSALIEHFHVSIETVRRDLLLLEQQQRLTRVHGGAVVKGDMKPFRELRERTREYSEEKGQLSRLAAEFVTEGDVIGIDAGSTAVFFAEAVRERFSALTVVTYSLDVFEILCNHKDFHAVLCGGLYKRHENAFYGSLTQNALANIHMQKAFMFPSAISLDGLFEHQDDLNAAQSRMVASADEIFILADSSKFEKKALLKWEDMKPEYRYITDEGLPQALKQVYRENNIRIYTNKSEIPQKNAAEEVQNL